MNDDSSVAASLCDARGPTPKPGRSRAARRAAATGFALLAFSVLAADWKIAEPGWRYEFPRDHEAHREFKTEWWYLTGNLFDPTGRRFGYELTFFRHGIRPASQRNPEASRFIVDDLKFAHFAVTDVDGKQFHFDQKMSRGAFGEAGFEAGARLAWIEGWTLMAKGDDEFDVAAATGFGSLRLHLRGAKPPVVHGENGVSVKAAGGTSASHYYSMPRLETTGELILDGATRSLRGETWFDHEWSTSQLGKGEIGWDWVCLQFEDGAALMLYRMRLESGDVEPSSSGTWISPDGATTHLRAADFQMTPTAFWKSKITGAKYPVGWRVGLPAQQAEFTVRTVLDDQELRLGAITYWEGAIDASGTREGKPLKGRGYLELTGYAGRMGESLNR
jgi:predicted secreted hydrolase